MFMPSHPASRLKCALINCRSASKHATDIYDLILSNDLDIIVLTETSLNSSSSPILDLLVPPNHDLIRLDRNLKHGGGIACIYRSSNAVKQADSLALPHCEYLSINITDDKRNVCKLHILYHPPGDNLAFIDELMDIITSNVNSQVPQIFLGDFNLHWNNANDQGVNCLKSFLTDHDLSQFCGGPTHSKGETLDLIIAKPSIISVNSITPCDWTDHFCILFDINIETAGKKNQPIKIKHWKRNLRDINPADFVSRCSTALTPPSGMVTAQDLTSFYNSTILEILDATAPLQEKNLSDKKSKPWFNENLNDDQRKLRSAERLWRSDPPTDHLYHLRLLRNTYKRKILKAKSDYFKMQLSQAVNRPKKLFEIVKQQTRKTPNPTVSNDSDMPDGNELANFFLEKINSIANDIHSRDPCPQLLAQVAMRCSKPESQGVTLSTAAKNNASWNTFVLIPEQEILNTLLAINPSNHFSDLLPPSLFKLIQSSILPLWTKIINASLSQGSIPDCLKIGQITPILKKPDAIASDLNNYRPISNLPTLTKLLEKCVQKQLCDHIEK